MRKGMKWLTIIGIMVFGLSIAGRLTALASNDSEESADPVQKVNGEAKGASDGG